MIMVKNHWLYPMNINTNSECLILLIYGNMIDLLILIVNDYPEY